jgi:hypothetical protein
MIDSMKIEPRYFYRYVVRAQVSDNLVPGRSGPVGGVGLPKPATSTTNVRNPSCKRRIYGFELLISHTRDECLHPWALRLGMRQLPVEIRMCIAINAVFGRSVCLPFIGVVESSRR